MDPNANLHEQRRLVKEMIKLADAATISPVINARIQSLGERLSELSQALDEWIVKGGFLPYDWQVAQSKRRTS